MLSSRRDVIAVPRIWITVALSILLHVLVLWRWMPQVHSPSSEELKLGESKGPLIVELAPPLRRRSPPAVRASPQRQQARPSAVPHVARPKAIPRPKASAPVLALKTPAPDVRAPRVAPAPPTEPARAAPEGDLASYIEARRRARGEVAAPPQTPAPPQSIASAPREESENERANRIAIANLASTNQRTFGYDPRRGGGVFSIRRMNPDYAEFLFFGWNKEARANTAQIVEVSRGTNSNIRIAVVRRMIAIIRDHEDGDFVWESKRLGRNVTLSARLRDNAGLEDFMMREFFEETRGLP